MRLEWLFDVRQLAAPSAIPIEPVGTDGRTDARTWSLDWMVGGSILRLMQIGVVATREGALSV